MAVEDLTWAVGELAELSTGEFEVDHLLRRLCDVAAAALPVDGVGVMKTGADNATVFVHASDPPLTGLERLQETRQEGPCRDAIDTRSMIAASSVADMRWPAFQKIAAEIGMHAVLAVPMISGHQVFGTLDLYWRTDHQSDSQDRAAAQLLANVAVSYLVMAQDRAQGRRDRDQLAHRALHDQLTGLPNRALLQEMLEHALAAAQRKATLVAVLFIDLDRFKPINDTHGHQAGDEVLQIVAQRMHGAVRAGDVVGRISGDEFLVICDDLDERHRAVQDLDRLGQRIRNTIAELIQLAGISTPIQVTASIGIAVTAEHPTATELIRAADLAMYEAKNVGGGNQVMTVQHP